MDREVKFTEKECWGGPVSAARNKGRSILVWVDHEDGKLSLWKVLPDGRKFWIRIKLKG
jgi:hypothetical protein